MPPATMLAHGPSLGARRLRPQRCHGFDQPFSCADYIIVSRRNRTVPDFSLRVEDEKREDLLDEEPVHCGATRCRGMNDPNPRLDDDPHPFRLRLYVAGPAKSVTALANLKRVCEEHLAGRYYSEVIDLFKNLSWRSATRFALCPPWCASCRNRQNGTSETYPTRKGSRRPGHPAQGYLVLSGAELL